MGVPRPSYQWLFNGLPLLGAIAPSLVLTNLQTNQSGSYVLVASNTLGTAQSAPASVTVNTYFVFVTDTVIAADNTNYDGLDVTVNGATVTVDGVHNFRNLSVANGGQLTCSPGGPGLNITISQNATVTSNSGISADAAGYAGTGANGAGPGGGAAGWGLSTAGGGGGYGGAGGPGASGAAGGGGYGSVVQPTDLGSAGGATAASYGGIPGGAGGGAIRLNVGGLLRVDGTISANGATGQASWSRSGGGAGGSVWITTSSLAGSGKMQADGGSSLHDANYEDGGGGGGGRIALYFTNNQWTGALSAKGAFGATYGGAGTIYQKAASQTLGTLMVDNGGSSGALTPIPGSYNFDSLIVTNQAQLELNQTNLLSPGCTIIVANGGPST